VGSNPILSTIFNIESAPGNNRFLSCSSSFLYADVRKAENAAPSFVRILHCHSALAHVPVIVFKHLHESSCLLVTKVVKNTGKICTRLSLGATQPPVPSFATKDSLVVGPFETDLLPILCSTCLKAPFPLR